MLTLKDKIGQHYYKILIFSLLPGITHLGVNSSARIGGNCGDRFFTCVQHL